MRYILTLVLFTFILGAAFGCDPLFGPSKGDGSANRNTRVYKSDRKILTEPAVPAYKLAVVKEIIKLENEWKQSPGRTDLKEDLVTVHEIYARSIVRERGVDLAILNRVLYSHYQRILQLDPSNAEAVAGLNGTRAWYYNTGVTLPTVVDPLDFLPGHAPKETEQETE